MYQTESDEKERYEIVLHLMELYENRRNNVSMRGGIVVASLALLLTFEAIIFQVFAAVDEVTPYIILFWGGMVISFGLQIASLYNALKTLGWMTAKTQKSDDRLMYHNSSTWQHINGNKDETKVSEEVRLNNFYRLVDGLNYTDLRVYAATELYYGMYAFRKRYYSLRSAFGLLLGSVFVLSISFSFIVFPQV